MKKLITKSLWFSLSLIIGFTIVAFGAALIFEPTVERTALTDSEKLIKLPEPIKISSRLLIGGDVFLGRSVERNSLASELKYGFPFSRIDSLGLENYQGVIANLECPVTTTIVPFSEQATYLKFNCLPEFLPELAKYFDIVSLANNHTDNVGGEAGLIETREHLEQNNFQYFGHFDNAETEDLCEVITVGAVLLYDNGLTENTSMPVALCGYHGVFKIPLENELAMISHYSRYLPTIVMPHMGAEYRTVSDSIRERVYRQMIDNGADLVAGGHPHWVQNTENYDGKLIVYSMGNLIFDQKANQEVQRSLMIDVTIEADFDDNVMAWVALAEKCRGFKDACLELAESSSLAKLEADLQLDIVATKMENMVVGLADKYTRSAVIDRAGWPATSAELAN